VGKPLRWSISFRKASAYLFLFLAVAATIALSMSFVTTPLRVLILATLVVGATALIAFLAHALKPHPRLRPLAALVFFALICWFAVGTRPVSPDLLRREYVRQLGTFKGTPYVWGGETRGGIDCSGLPRVSLWKAMVSLGLRTGNLRLLGPQLWRFWMTDVGARDICAGAHGFSRRLGQARRIAGCDTSRLQPGDMAVAGGGGHVMVYYGGGRWIDAAPELHQVVVNPAPANSTRGWFHTRVTFCRWRILDTPGTGKGSLGS
jgi:hypothetical protein